MCHLSVSAPGECIHGRLTASERRPRLGRVQHREAWGEDLPVVDGEVVRRASASEERHGHGRRQLELIHGELLLLSQEEQRNDDVTRAARPGD